MLEPRSKTIDDLSFTLSPMPARRGLKMFTRLARVLGPALGQLGEGFKTGGSLAAMDIAPLGAALGTAFGALDDTETDAIVNGLLDTCRVEVEGKSIRFLDVMDALIAGRTEVLFKLLAWAVEVNYGGFFKGLLGLGAKPAPSSP